jgi:hypothetical protein
MSNINVGNYIKRLREVLPHVQPVPAGALMCPYFFGLLDE